MARPKKTNKMKTIRDINVVNKRVLVRADFNVSLDRQKKVIDDFRIRATLPTIRYLISQGAKIILIAHLGRPEGEMEELRLEPVQERIEELLGAKIDKAPDCIGAEVEKLAKDLSSGQVLLLENLRFYHEEEANDSNFAQALAKLGEVYVNDAFGVSHRAHASVEAITKFLPSFAGLLLEKEIQNLSRARDNPEHPLVVVIGGTKISSKIKLIQNFLGRAEDIILGGALANTVLHAKGIAVGKSFVEEMTAPEIKKLEITDTRLHLPLDAILCPDKEGRGVHRRGPIGKTRADELILDIGPDSEALFARIIGAARMVIWNGPMGLFEVEVFAHGTQAIAEAITRSPAFSLVGGGETVAFLERLNLIDKFSFASTGGGAMMEFLTGETLPGLVALERS